MVRLEAFWRGGTVDGSRSPGFNANLSWRGPIRRIEHAGAAFPQIFDTVWSALVQIRSGNSRRGAENQGRTGPEIHAHWPITLFCRPEARPVGSLRRSGRVTRIMSAVPLTGGRIVTSDVGFGRAIHPDLLLVLGYGLPSPDKAGKSGVHKFVTGKDAVVVGVQPGSF